MINKKITNLDQLTNKYMLFVNYICAISFEFIYLIYKNFQIKSQYYMSCCGNKKDVNHISTGNAKHKQIRATKILGVDDAPVASDTKGFIPIRQKNIGGPEKLTKQQDYSRENVSGSKSRLVDSINQLNFQLDQEPGVSNTFDIPTFDYQTMLSHNIFSNKNARSHVVVQDGYTSKIRNSNVVTSGVKA